MKNEHVTITWPSGNKEDVCKDCTKRLNDKLKELRDELDNIYVVGIKKDAPLFMPSKERPLTYLGKFTDFLEAEECRRKYKADYDRVVIVNDLDDALEVLANMKEENE